MQIKKIAALKLNAVSVVHSTSLIEFSDFIYIVHLCRHYSIREKAQQAEATQWGGRTPLQKKGTCRVSWLWGPLEKTEKRSAG